jgi:hypothetical protein
MLLGLWKNIEDLENSICIEELELIVSASRDREMREFRFAASLKGIDIDAQSGGPTAADRVEEMKRKAEATRNGMTEEEFDLDELGLDLESE